MDAVILFSHGALLCGSGEALLAHAARLWEQAIAPIVEIGYLNYTEPPFATAVERCVAQGANRILVVPYFLVPGKFVKVDLPQAIQREAEKYSDVAFCLGEALGFDEALADALLQSAADAMPPEQWGDTLARASNHCRPNPECPLYNTASCPKHPHPLSDEEASSEMAASEEAA